MVRPDSISCNHKSNINNNSYGCSINLLKLVVPLLSCENKEHVQPSLRKQRNAIPSLAATAHNQEKVFTYTVYKLSGVVILMREEWKD